MLAERDPVADGVKFTPIEQLAPAPMLAPQLLAWLNSPAFAPVIVILEMFNATLPLFVSVMSLRALVVPTA